MLQYLFYILIFVNLFFFWNTTDICESYFAIFLVQNKMFSLTTKDRTFYKCQNVYLVWPYTSFRSIYGIVPIWSITSSLPSLNIQYLYPSFSLQKSKNSFCKTSISIWLKKSSKWINVHGSMDCINCALSKLTIKLC